MQVEAFACWTGYEFVTSEMSRLEWDSETGPSSKSSQKAEQQHGETNKSLGPGMDILPNRSEDAASSGAEDDIALFHTSSFASNAFNETAHGVDAAPLDFMYQPGAMLHCFDLAVRSHDEQNPNQADWRWSAPPLTVREMLQESSAAISAESMTYRKDILGDWKPRVLPKPTWMESKEWDQEVTPTPKNELQ